MSVVRSCVSTAVLLASSALIVHASGETNTIRGELSCSSCRSYSDLVIEVQDSANHSSVGTFYVNSTGSFEMQGVQPGTYIVTVRNASGPLSRQMVSINGQSGMLNLAIDDTELQTAKSSDAVVSVHRLTHKVPKAARKQFEKALAAGDDNGTVITCLKRATEIDPEYVEALNNLGSRYLLTNQFDKSLEVLKQAVAIDPSSPFVNTNLAAALIATNQNAEAEEVARRAVQLSSSSEKARYMLGLALYNEKKFTDEAVQMLRDAQPRFPNAGLALAVITARRGDRSTAESLLQQYLASGRPERRVQAERMLAALKQSR